MPVGEDAGVKMTRKQLEIFLTRLQGIANPKLGLEQYPTPPEIASAIIHWANLAHCDIRGKRVADLGTGNGILAIGAAKSGALEVVGVENDRESIRVARMNARRASVDVSWVMGDIESIQGGFDTVLMNPPFGTRRKHADLRFLEKALEIAGVIYSIHKSSTREFIMKFLRRRGAKLVEFFPSRVGIPHLYPFHRDRRRNIEVDIYRIVGPSRQVAEVNTELHKESKD
jgi:putative methylase